MQVSDSSSRILAGLLEARTGQQLTMSRRWRIETALAQVLRERSIPSIDELITMLVTGREPALANAVVEALLNNETYFYRDRAPFDLLTRTVLPRLVRQRSKIKRLNIWSAGCSTGQEAYSLAMMFAENPQQWADWKIEILATDVSEAAIHRARSGVYSQFEVQRGLGVTQMIRWFNETPEGWVADERLKRAIRFQVHNLLEATPIGGGFDIVLCRNVLLYLNTDRRRHVFERIASAMADDGTLMLGAGETVIGQTDRFESDVEARGLYRRRMISQPRAAIGA